jgi:hypothetical protein
MLFKLLYFAREMARRLFSVELDIWNNTGYFPFLEAFSRFNGKLECPPEPSRNH